MPVSRVAGLMVIGAHSGSGMGQEAVTGTAAGHDPEELDGVDPGRGDDVPAHEGATGRAGELQHERVDVRGRPVGHHVGHQPSVVLGGEDEIRCRSRG